MDDLRDMAHAAVLPLDQLGFVAACDGPTALAVASEFRPDVGVFGLNMPGMDGEELAVLLRERARPHPPRLVAVTARGGELSRPGSPDSYSSRRRPSQR